MISLMLASAALSAAPTPVLAPLNTEDGSYEGSGFSQDLYIQGLLPGQVAQMEVGSLASFRDYPDLALRLDDGRVFVNADTIVYGGYQLVSESNTITSMTVNSKAADSQLLMTDGSSLLRLSWTDLKPDGSGRTLETIAISGVTLSSAELLSSDSDVLLLNAGGTSCLILDGESDGLTLMSEIVATEDQVKFHDARLVNFSSDPNRPDQIAVITDQGLEILEQDGSPALFGGNSHSLAGSPLGAGLAVLRAEDTASDRDFLLWKFHLQNTGDVIVVLNCDHIEWIYAMGLGLEDFILASWQDPNGLGELVLPLGMADSIWLSQNTGATNVGSNVFAVAGGPINAIDLSLLGGGASQGPALVRSLDMDLDGADDLVIVDSDNHLCILPGMATGAITERASVVMHVVDGATSMDITVPAYVAAGVHYSVWWQEDEESEAGPVPLESDTLTGPFPGQEMNFAGITFPYFSDGIYTIVFEPFDENDQALPPTALLWATDPSRDQDMHDIATDTFPWGPPFVAPPAQGSSGNDGPPGNDGPNGTNPVPRPRVHPLPCPEGGC